MNNKRRKYSQNERKQVKQDKRIVNNFCAIDTVALFAGFTKQNQNNKTG